MKKIIKESTGRDLVGAGNFTSRKSVVEKILKKYPNPKSLAAALADLAKKTKEPKVKDKLMELATTCAACTQEQYPAFVAKIAGFSKLWGIVGKTVGAAALAGAATWLISAFVRSDDALNAQDKATNSMPDVKVGPAANHDVIHTGVGTRYGVDDSIDLGRTPYKHSIKDTIKGMGSVMKGDISNARSFASEKFDNITDRIKNWRSGFKDSSTLGREAMAKPADTPIGPGYGTRNRQMKNNPIAMKRALGSQYFASVMQ